MGQNATSFINLRREARYSMRVRPDRGIASALLGEHSRRLSS